MSSVARLRRAESWAELLMAAPPPLPNGWLYDATPPASWMRWVAAVIAATELSGFHGVGVGGGRLSVPPNQLRCCLSIDHSIAACWVTDGKRGAYAAMSSAWTARGSSPLLRTRVKRR